MDTRLDEDEAEFGVLVFAVALEMLPDGDGLGTVVNIQAVLEKAFFCHVLCLTFLINM